VESEELDFASFLERSIKHSDFWFGAIQLSFVVLSIGCISFELFHFESIRIITIEQQDEDTG